MLTILNDHVDYGKRLCRSYPNDRVDFLNVEKRALNLNDRVDHAKQSC